MTRVSDLSNDELVLLYIQLRDKRASRKKEFEMADGADKAKQEKIEDILLVRYREMGIESARTKHGTAFKQKVGHASIADREVLRQQIADDPDNWALVTILPNKAGIKAYIEEHGDLPPGINWSEEYELRVTRA